ncbi:MAG: hypothetical protein QOF48_2884 [Verrucomicrobiota bacterium]|jgi:hypothetical protein
MRKLRVGVLDLVAGVRDPSIYARVMFPNFAARISRCRDQSSNTSVTSSQVVPEPTPEIAPICRPGR